MPCLGLLPAFKEQGDFRFSPDQGCESPYLSHIKATGSTALTEHVIDAHRLGDATQGLCSQVLTREIALDQSIGRFAGSNRIGSCQSLNSRCHVGCLAKGKLLLSATTAHSPHND